MTGPPRWVLKAALQQVLSHVPRGADLNYLLQRHVTKTLPASTEHVDMHVEQAVEHWRCFQQLNPALPPARADFFEFGAGWDLIGPVTLWGLGVERQTLVDVRPNLRPELWQHTLRTYADRRQQLEERLGVRLRPLEPLRLSSVADLQQLGIRYLAPCDARATGLPARSIDVVTSTFTLEHVPPADITAILGEMRRLLRPGGLLLSSIDLQDHYSFFDESVSPYGFLRFSDRTWRLANPALHHQNRMRHPEYRELFERAGWTVVLDRAQGPSDGDREVLRGMTLAESFRGLPLDELGVRETYLVARP